MRKTIYTYLSVMLITSFGAFLAACQKEEDPFVDRVAAPLLVYVNNAKDGSGLVTEPVIESGISGSVTIISSFYELDKSGLLNNAAGIDSIPAASLEISLNQRNGGKIADLVTDPNGKITLTKTWAELSVSAPKAGNTVPLSFTGQYKGQPFTKYLKVQAVN